MHLRYHAGVGLRHGATAIIEAGLILAIIAAFAMWVALATGNGPFGAARVDAGRVVASISFDASTARSSGSLSFGGQAGFRVDAEVSRDSDLYKLWVANKCYKGGDLVSAEYLPVKDGRAGDFMLGPAPTDGGPQGNWSGGAAECKAYVWMFPDPSKPLRGATMSYDVDK